MKVAVAVQVVMKGVVRGVVKVVVSARRALVEAGGHVLEEVGPLEPARRVEAAPVVQDVRLQDGRLAAAEGALLPPRQRQHVRQRALRHVGMHLLLAPVNIEGEPRRAYRAAAQHRLAVVGQRVGQRFEGLRLKVVGRLRAVQRVLAGHMPVVPHEAHGVRLARLGKVLVKAASKLAGETGLKELVDQPQVLWRRLRIDGRPQCGLGGLGLDRGWCGAHLQRRRPPGWRDQSGSRRHERGSGSVGGGEQHIHMCIGQRATPHPLKSRRGVLGRGVTGNR